MAYKRPDEKEWNLYCNTLKLGQMVYRKNNPLQTSGGLAWAYNLLGKYHEISLSHLQHMFATWDNEMRAK